MTKCQQWLYEDELPDDYPYERMFPFSKLGLDGLGGVRLFPKDTSRHTQGQTPEPPACNYCGARTDNEIIMHESGCKNPMWNWLAGERPAGKE